MVFGRVRVALIIWLTCDFFNMVFGGVRVALIIWLTCDFFNTVFGGVRVAHLFVCLLLLSYYVSLRSELRVVVSVTISA